MRRKIPTLFFHRHLESVIMNIGECRARDRLEMNAEDDKTELLGLLKEMTRWKMPHTMTFIPHKMKKRFARILSRNIPEIARLVMSEGIEQDREHVAMLVWAILALIRTRARR